MSSPHSRHCGLPHSEPHHCRLKMKEEKGLDKHRNEHAERCATVKGVLNHSTGIAAIQFHFPLQKKSVTFYFSRSSPGQRSHFSSQGSHQQPPENHTTHCPAGAGERLWLESPLVSYGRSLSQSFSACHSFL